MGSYSELQSAVSGDLFDPSNATFSLGAVKDFIQQGLFEVGRIAPQQFQEDLAPVADQLTYPLRSTVFTVTPPEIRLVRVEVWTGVPPRFKFKIKSKAGQPTRDSTAGWEVWDGTLELPQSIVDYYIDTANDLIRVWGYSPYPPVVLDTDTIPVSDELQLAVRTFCRIEAMKRLISSRTLFKQWQMRSNNTDVTLGMLNSDLQSAQDEWHRLSRALKVPEQNPD